MEINFREAEIRDFDTLMKYMGEFHDLGHTEPFDRIPARNAMKKLSLISKLEEYGLSRKPGTLLDILSSCLVIDWSTEKHL